MKFSERDLRLFQVSDDIASKAHAGQFRKDGKTPYVVHCRQAAAMAAAMGLHPLSISVMLVHDVLEDTDVTLEQITRSLKDAGFSELSFDFVEYTNRLQTLTKNKGERHVDYLRRITKSAYSVTPLLKIADIVVNWFDTTSEMTRVREKMELSFEIVNRDHRLHWDWLALQYRNHVADVDFTSSFQIT
jgi:(p)ppGpp synthase/HD superfamily hydrolase